MKKYRLSKRSRERLAGVHPDLIAVVHRAIQITSIDFSVLEGVRTKKRQRALLNASASRTMKSRHLKQQDGYAHAVDLGAYVKGEIRWDWPLYHLLDGVMVRDIQGVGNVCDFALCANKGRVDIHIIGQFQCRLYGGLQRYGIASMRG